MAASGSSSSNPILSSSNGVIAVGTAVGLEMGTGFLSCSESGWLGKSFFILSLSFGNAAPSVSAADEADGAGWREGFDDAANTSAGVSWPAS